MTVLPHTIDADGLSIEELTVRYGATVAVDAVTLTAPVRRLTGLIGPNGAGKTTTFNACSGLLRPATGRVRLFGTDVTRSGPANRARRGLGRTFQRMELFTSMTVAENVSLGREVRFVGGNPLRQIVGTRRQQRQVREAAAEALEVCGIAALAEEPVATLSTGQRRLVELARAYAGHYRILLLDEPSSGLDHTESEQFGAILRRLVDEEGLGILLVEHDMGLVMSVCDYLYVLDFGEMIFEGTPPETQQSDVVRAAYLGDASGLEAHPAPSGAT